MSISNRDERKIDPLIQKSEFQLTKKKVLIMSKIHNKTGRKKKKKKQRRKFSVISTKQEKAAASSENFLLGAQLLTQHLFLPTH